jgi:hypothetical protein
MVVHNIGWKVISVLIGVRRDEALRHWRFKGAASCDNELSWRSQN